MNIKIKDKVYLKKDLICGLPTGPTTISKGTEAEITYVDNNIIGIIIHSVGYGSFSKKEFKEFFSIKEVSKTSKKSGLLSKFRRNKNE